jgi:ribosomal protein L11 methyltransferase
MYSPEESIETLRITTPAEYAERLEFALERLAESSSCWQPASSERAVIEAYFECAEDADRASVALTAQLMALTGNSSLWSIERETLPAKDWSNAWKAFFHVERVSKRIITKPTWEPYTPQPGDCVIELDPGMSFGTGQHETTRGCLRFLDRLTNGMTTSGSFLDLGCGSGILSIAAAKLGCRPVRAIDIDEDSVVIASENIAANGCAAVVTVASGDVAHLAEAQCYDIVAANILAPVLIEHAAAITDTVAAGGHLLLAGILTPQYGGVREAYGQLGLLEQEIVTEGEWTSARWQKQPPSHR